jgi:hypothetical protein
MTNKQAKLGALLSILSPSPLSAVCSVTLAIATIVLNQFESIRQFLRLPDVAVLLRAVAVWLDTILTTVLGEARTNVVVVGAFWAIVGLGVYVFLRGLARFISELDDDIVVRRYVWPKGADRTRPLRIMFERTAFRLIALAALALVVFGPLAATLRGPVLARLTGGTMVVEFIVWFLASLLLWHLVVVLLRLVALRLRLTGEA